MQYNRKYITEKIVFRSIVLHCTNLLYVINIVFFIQKIFSRFHTSSQNYFYVINIFLTNGGLSLMALLALNNFLLPVILEDHCYLIVAESQPVLILTIVHLPLLYFVARVMIDLSTVDLLLFKLVFRKEISIDFVSSTFLYVFIFVFSKFHQFMNCNILSVFDAQII